MTKEITIDGKVFTITDELHGNIKDLIRLHNSKILPGSGAGNYYYLMQTRESNYMRVGCRQSSTKEGERQREERLASCGLFYRDEVEATAVAATTNIVRFLSMLSKNDVITDEVYIPHFNVTRDGDGTNIGVEISLFCIGLNEKDDDITRQYDKSISNKVNRYIEFTPAFATEESGIAAVEKVIDYIEANPTFAPIKYLTVVYAFGKNLEKIFEPKIVFQN